MAATRAPALLTYLMDQHGLSRAAPGAISYSRGPTHPAAEIVRNRCVTAARFGSAGVELTSFAIDTRLFQHRLVATTGELGVVGFLGHLGDSFRHTSHGQNDW
jgi:hypothetical protein